MPFEFVDHTADLAIRVTAREPAELFQAATEALVAVYMGKAEFSPAAVLGDETPIVKRVTLEAPDGEALLIDYLNELIFLFDAERFLCAAVEVDQVALGEPAALDGKLLGAEYDACRHTLQTEIKAATFHNVKIRREKGQFIVTVVLDL